MASQSDWKWLQVVSRSVCSIVAMMDTLQSGVKCFLGNFMCIIYLLGVLQARLRVGVIRMHPVASHQYQAIIREDRLQVRLPRQEFTSGSDKLDLLQQGRVQVAEYSEVIRKVQPMAQRIEYLESMQQAFQALLQPTALVPTLVTIYFVHGAPFGAPFQVLQELFVPLAWTQKPGIQISEVYLQSTQ